MNGPYDWRHERPGPFALVHRWGSDEEEAERERWQDFALAPPAPPYWQVEFTRKDARRIKAAALVTVVLLAGFLSFRAGAATKHEDMHVLNANTCQEDEPCWDCSTMGNRVCGTPCSEQVIDLRPFRTCTNNRP
jgi:hypothetical protein